MTDRELLELAAKAAGIEVHESDDGTMQRRPVLAMTHYVQGQPYSETRWDPLRDDAQALRLAVKLQLTVQVGSLDGTVVVTSNNDSRIYEAENYLPGGDPYAAARRAIVRAAAELAKSGEDMSNPETSINLQADSLPTCEINGVTYVAKATGSANTCNGCVGEPDDAVCGRLDPCCSSRLGEFIWIRKE